MSKPDQDQKPNVSVILPVYNGEQYLAAAIDSILSQTYKDFELIIINDGSTDKSQALINQYKDPRIIAVNQKNHGLVASLNRGIGMARGQYIARMDADDISLPERLAREVQSMDQNPHLVLLGTNAIEIDQQGKKSGELTYPSNDSVLRLSLFSYTPFAHGSVMFKTASVNKVGGYDPATWPAEDSDLWARLAREGGLANIDQALYKFRINPEGISLTNRESQIAKTLAVRRKMFKDARAILKSPLTIHRALSQSNDQSLRTNARLITRVSIIRLRPITSLFMLLSLALSLPAILGSNKNE
jgi:glycosyltransferase involved in cell wall biosynthesis